MVRCSGVLGMALVGGLVFFLSACASHVSQTGGETNWLCEADSDCTGSFRCVKRRCAAPETAAASASGGTANGGADSSGRATGATPAAASGGATDAGRGMSEPVTATDAAGCNTNYSRYDRDSGQEVSLRNDVMPVFGLSCTASDCHNPHDRKAALNLGWRCVYDAAKRACIFPVAEDPNTVSSNPPKPLTDDVVNAVYASLLADSATASASGVKQVVPGDPSRSFLMDKLANTQGQRGYTCTNQDPSHEVRPVPCGDSMPLASDVICASPEGQAGFDLIARWIAEGAKNN